MKTALIIAGVAVLAVAGYAVWQNQQDSSSMLSSTETMTETTEQAAEVNTGMYGTLTNMASDVQAAGQEAASEISAAATEAADQMQQAAEEMSSDVEPAAGTSAETTTTTN